MKKRTIVITVIAVLLLAIIVFTCYGIIKKYGIEKELTEKYTITEEQWNAAINYENYSVSTVNPYGKEDVYKFTKEGYCSYSKTYGETKYVFIGEQCYELVKAGDGWVAQYSALADDHKMFSSYVDYWNELVYNEETNSYVYADGWDTVEFQFEYGVLVRYKITMFFGDSETTAEYFVFDVGQTHVDFPEYRIAEQN